MMKIGIVSRGRTYSSIIAKTISQQYETINHHEVYSLCRAKSASLFANKPNSTLSEKKEALSKAILEQTYNLFTHHSKFSCKIWPSMLTVPPSRIALDQSYTDVKDRIIFDINDHLSLSNYNKLYFLNRGLHYSTLSWVYANKVKIFEKRKNLNINFPVVNFDQNDYEWAKFYILEYCLQEKLKEFITKLNVEFIDIPESNLDLYTNKKLPEGKKSLFYNPTEKNMQNYQDLVQDVNYFYNYVSKEYTECSNQIKNWSYI